MAATRRSNPAGDPVPAAKALGAGRITPNDYLDPAVLALERERILFRYWHLVGLRSDLPADGAWRVIVIAGVEIILRRAAKDTLRAFTNVCPHRFSRLCGAAEGAGTLRCGYHLWSFDDDGVPDAVPFRGDVPLDACRAAPFHLERWAVETCGPFVFVARRPVETLRRFLGACASPLAAIASALGPETLRFTQDIRANWKILLQNTVEFDHAAGVHPETFNPMMARPLMLKDEPASPPHIAYHAAIRPPERPRPGEKKLAALFARIPAPPVAGYLHYTLFPSATVGTTQNRQFALVTYQPVAVDLTRAVYRLFRGAIPDLTEAEAAILDKVVPADVAFTRQLLEEDRRICENVQQGVAMAPPDMPGALLPGERRVGRFQHSWAEAMERG